MFTFVIFVKRLETFREPWFCNLLLKIELLNFLKEELLVSASIQDLVLLQLGIASLLVYFCTWLHLINICPLSMEPHIIRVLVSDYIGLE